VKKIFLIVLALLVYGAFVVMMTPARFAFNLMTLPSQLKLGAISGTIWSGQIASIASDDLRLESVVWQVLPSHFISLDLAADINVGTTSSEIIAQGQVSVSSSAVITVEQLIATTTADYLTTITPLPMGLKASGKVKLNVSRFVYSQLWCDTLDGRLTVNNAQVASDFGSVPVEYVDISLGCKQHKLIATLKPANNSLGIDIEAQLSPTRQVTVLGAINPPHDAPQDFINLLKFSGQQDKLGRYPIVINTRLN